MKNGDIASVWKCVGCCKTIVLGRAVVFSLHPTLIPFKGVVLAWRVRVGDTWHLCWTLCEAVKTLREAQ